MSSFSPDWLAKERDRLLADDVEPHDHKVLEDRSGFLTLCLASQGVLTHPLPLHRCRQSVPSRSRPPALATMLTSSPLIASHRLPDRRPPQQLPFVL